MKNMERFIKVLKRNECEFSSVTIGCDEVKGQGLFANLSAKFAVPMKLSSPIELVSIPKSYAINGSTLFDILRTDEEAFNIFNEFITFITNNPTPIKKFTQKLSITLSLIFISSCTTSISSKYEQYIESLPKTFNTPICWSEEDLRSLEETPLFSACISKKKSLLFQFKFLYENLFKPLSSCSSFHDFEVSYEKFVWADSIVNSRVISCKLDQDEGDKFNGATFSFERPDLYLVPLIDLCNHDPEPNVRWEVSNDRISLLTYAGVNIRHGAELCLTYGSKSNSELLFTHGFALEAASKYESFHFPVYIDQDDELQDKKVALIRHLSLPFMIEICRYKISKRYDGHLLDCLVSNSNALTLCIACTRDYGKLHSAFTCETKDVLNCFEVEEKDEALSQIYAHCCNQLDALRNNCVYESEEKFINLYSKIYKTSLVELLELAIELIKNYFL